MNCSELWSWLQNEAVTMSGTADRCQHALTVGGIDKVSTGFVKRVEQLEGRFLVRASNAELLPFIPNARTAQLKR